MPKFLISMNFSFEGKIEIFAENEEQAKEFALKDCVFTSGGGFQSSLPDSTLLDWEFPMISDKSITKIKQV